MRRRQCLKACAAVVGLVASSYRLTVPGWAAEEGVRRRLRFSVSVRNPTGQQLDDQHIWLYVPALETPTQRLDAVKVSMGHELQSDALRHGIVHLAFPSVAPWATKLVDIVADVVLRSTPVADPLANPQDWLGPERFVETKDKDIRALAAELTRPREWETVQAIYDWLRQHLQYAGYVPEDGGASVALNRRRGDCTEYAYLAVALARCAGIPARMVGGYVIDRDSVLRAKDYHNWAEVYFDGAWWLLDAQKERWLAPTEQYVAFRFYRDEVINPIGLAHRFKVKGDLQVWL